MIFFENVVEIYRVLKLSKQIYPKTNKENDSPGILYRHAVVLLYRRIED